MRNYAIKRLLLFIPTVIGASMAIFAILRILPGDIAAQIIQAGDPEATVTEEERQRVIALLGLDRPIYVQYVDWVWGVVRMDLGNSYVFQRPVAEYHKAQFPVTLQIALVAAIAVAAKSLPIGI